MNLPHHRSPGATPPSARVESPLAERALDERSAVTAALLNATSRLVAQTDAMAVIRSMCESLVSATPHIRLAWAWFGDPHTREIRPMVSVGPARAYAESLVIEKNLLTRFGPAFRSLSTNQPDATAISRFSLYGPWRAASRTHGFEVAVAFPLRVPNAQERGLLVFYADDADYFKAIGIAPFRAFALLAETALAQADLRMQLQRQATVDALTGLPNRFLLREELERVHANAMRHCRTYAVVMFDLDRFKAINDCHGHDAGDRALIAAGNAATHAVRRGDIVGRWGGDEFLAILPETEVTEALALAGRLRDQLCASTVDCDGTSIAIHASAGVAAYPVSADAPHALLIAADQALYRAKHEGGDRVVAASCTDEPAPRAA
jgi:diguanylate cyclase (GGDEF)-like protein